VVTVRPLYEDAGAAAVLSVQDSGIGIPASDLPHIFERFYRADAHRAKTTGGTGLGLAIALENVHLHGGSITVASEVGKGSVFTVVLPAVKSPSEPCPDEEAAAEPQPQPEAVAGDGDSKSEAEVVLGG